MSEPEAEHYEIMRAILADLTADLLDTAIEQELAERVMQLHADGADEPGMGRPLHEEPQRLRHESVDLAGGEAARIRVIEPRIVDHRIDDRAVLLDERGRHGTGPVEQLDDLGETLRESGARCNQIAHAALSQRLTE